MDQEIEITDEMYEAATQEPEVPPETAPASEPASEVQSPQLPDPYAAPPKSWAKDYHQGYQTLDPKLRSYIHQRESEQLAGISKYRKEAEFGSKLRERMTPYESLLQEHNIDPVQAFDTLMRVHVGLTMGSPEDKRQWAQYIQENYKLQELLQAAQAPAPDPVVQQLAAQVQSLQQNLFEQRKKEVLTEIESFAKDPKNKYFNDLYDDIVEIIKSGAADNISKAYEVAMWQNPKIRQQAAIELAAQLQGADSGKPNSGKPGQKPLRSSSEPVAPGKKPTSIDDTLEEVANRLFS